MSKTWKDLILKLEKLQNEFTEVAHSLGKTKRERSGVCGSWSPKQVVAHMTGWDKEVIYQFELFQEGLEETIEHDIDAFNEKSVRERENLSWKETLDEFEETHEKFIKKANSIPIDEIHDNKEYKNWLNVQIEHYEHHLKQLKEWT